MKVHELIEQLNKYPADMDVMITVYAEQIYPLNSYESNEVDIDIYSSRPEIKSKVSNQTVVDIVDGKYQKVKKDVCKIDINMKGA